MDTEEIFQKAEDVADEICREMKIKCDEERIVFGRKCFLAGMTFQAHDTCERIGIEKYKGATA